MGRIWIKTWTIIIDSFNFIVLVEIQVDAIFFHPKRANIIPKYKFSLSVRKCLKAEVGVGSEYFRASASASASAKARMRLPQTHNTELYSK
jgi:hypothetical protein